MTWHVDLDERTMDRLQISGLIHDVHGALARARIGGQQTEVFTFPADPDGLSRAIRGDGDVPRALASVRTVPRGQARPEVRDWASPLTHHQERP